jgi:two-component system LytT family response regulator
MTLRTVIVDDEPLARKRLRRLLAEHPSLEIVGEAANGEEACAIIDATAPDLVFLDVQMPGLTGFDVLARLRRRPRIIFVTAHDEFAVRAFEEQALDYLLKPVEPKRLERALGRLQPTSVQAPGIDSRLERLLQVVERSGPAVRRIPVRKGARVVLLEPESIIFCRAEDKYAVIYTADGEHVVDKTIDDLEATLDPGTFIRVHRSTIVNLGCVRELTSIDGGRYVIALKQPAGTQIYASRAGAKALRDKLGF